MRSDREEWEEAGRKIRGHPGYVEYQELLAFERSITAVFGANLNELVALLDAAATNEDLAVELIQNVRPPVVRDRFHGRVTQRLHNYLASSESLAEHARRLMRRRTGAVVGEFERRKAELLQHPEVPFMKGLRNFTLHRRLPFFSHTLKLTNANTPDQKMESEVQISVAELLEWDGWAAPSRRYLESRGETLILRSVVKTHGQLVYRLNTSLHNELAVANEDALGEVNTLVVEANTIMAGGDRALAERMARRFETDEPGG